MSKAISRALLGKIVDEVFGGAIEDASVIEEIYAVINRHEAALSAAEPTLSVNLDRKLGIYGRAYDGPDTFRAYTSDHQPANIEAWRLGRSCAEIQPGGDYIDRGLHLLDALQRAGFGVFEIGAAPIKTEGCK